MTIYDLLDKHQHSLNRDQIRDLINYEIDRCQTTPGVTLFEAGKAVLLYQKYDELWNQEVGLKASQNLVKALGDSIIDPTTNPLKKKHGKHK